MTKITEDALQSSIGECQPKVCNHERQSHPGVPEGGWCLDCGAACDDESFMQERETRQQYREDEHA